MKRVILMLSSALILVSSCDEHDPSPARSGSDHRLVKILNYSSSLSDTPYNTMEMTYDTRGNLTKESLFSYPHTLLTYTDYEYDGTKRVRKLNYDGQVGNLTLGSSIKYNYTGDHMTKEELFLGDGSLKFTAYYKYSGDKLIETYKDGDGLGIHHHYKYSYNLSGRLILEQVYMYDEELENSTKYYYEDDRLIKSELYDRFDDLVSSIERKYKDADDLHDQELWFDANGNVVQNREITYDQLGNEIEITVDNQGTRNKLASRKYDGDLLIEEITYHPFFGYEEWTVTRYEYERQ